VDCATCVVFTIPPFQSTIVSELSVLPISLSSLLLRAAIGLCGVLFSPPDTFDEWPMLFSSGIALKREFDSISKRVNGLRDCLEREEGRRGENVARQSAMIIRPDSIVLSIPNGIELTRDVSWEMEARGKLDVQGNALRLNVTVTMAGILAIMATPDLF
jgi:hypothetical protein